MEKVSFTGLDWSRNEEVMDSDSDDVSMLVRK